MILQDPIPSFCLATACAVLLSLPAACERPCYRISIQLALMKVLEVLSAHVDKRILAKAILGASSSMATILHQNLAKPQPPRPPNESTTTSGPRTQDESLTPTSDRTQDVLGASRARNISFGIW